MSEWEYMMGQRVAELEQELEAAKERLEAVRGLMPGWKEGDFSLPDYARGKMDGRHECAAELEALLNQR